MPILITLRDGLKAGKYDAKLANLYGDLTAAKRRVQRLIELYADYFNDEGTEVSLFSAPGRTEIGGNHTDHNNGRVLAGAIELDTLGLAGKCEGDIIKLQSVGFAKNTVNIETLSPDEGGSTSDRIIRGVCAGFAKNGLPYGGFHAVTHSDVPPGSGLSSSAAFENLIGVIIDHLYGDGRIKPSTLARIGNFAENVYIQKPSGLMDQTASAVGGLSLMDFADPEKPQVESIPFDCPGHTMIITGPIGCHADLTPEYAAIPQEMRKVAWTLGQDTMRGVTNERFIAALPSMTTTISGRALLRAFHFLRENERAHKQAKALKSGDFEHFLQLVNESGLSSFMYLQNVVLQEEQGLGVALMLSEMLLNGRGAHRVHGGGFAGTIQAFVPDDILESYKTGMEAVFGIGSCLAVRIRKQGVVKVI
ncbi:MAG: galactokinase [Oscillospiraceae bacterium]|nr:galactokinase [Oscillospiraceae bacterium]